MYVESFELQLMHYTEYVAHKQILLYVPPVLLFIGTFGNLFSFCILLKNAKNASTYSYLSVLAIVDLLVLYSGLFRLWIGQFMIEIATINNFMCKTVIFIGYVSSDTSVWLIVAMTIERTIVVTFPLKAHTICNTRHARVGILSIIVLFILVNCHFLWSVELKHFTFNDTVISKCHPTPGYTRLVEDIWPWVDAIIYSFLPSFLILVLNSLIILNVISARNARKRLRQQSKLFLRNGNPSHHRQHCEVSKKITLMLLAVSFTFLVTTLPMNLVVIYKSVFLIPDNVKTLTQAKLMNTVAEMLMYTNHSINFFLYCATGKKFRNQFKAMVCYVCRKKPGSGRSSPTMRLAKVNQSRTDYMYCEPTTTAINDNRGTHL